MPSVRKGSIILGVLAFGAATGGAWAEGVDKSTQDAFQSIITRQIDAFGRDDAVTAHSFAAPGIKRMFPDAGAFNSMVHQSYAPLIHPKSTRFEPAAASEIGPVEKVTIVDDKGQVWTAVYTFEQVDGQWRINGCVLVQDKSTSV